MEAERSDCIVRHKATAVSERIEDILLVGYDDIFIRQHGKNTDFKWMLDNDKDHLLLELYNPKEPRDKILRRDFHSLADALGIPNNRLDEIQQQRPDKSVTEGIIRHWCKRNDGSKMTFQLFTKLLKHPGLVDNDHAAGILLNCVQQEVCVNELMLWLY